MKYRPERRAARPRADREGQREHPDGRQPQHPADEHQHRLGQRFKEACQRASFFVGQAGDGEGEQRGEHDQLKDGSLRSRLDDVGRDDRADEVGEPRNRGGGGIGVDLGQPGAQRSRRGLGQRE